MPKKLKSVVVYEKKHEDGIRERVSIIRGEVLVELGGPGRNKYEELGVEDADLCIDILTNAVVELSLKNR